ncbi:MAG: acyl-CoA dehydrogenase family protein [Bradyrhizobium sp.]|nr:acyl-CoA dehydrogenase family protein [Bradyrhizobium sp.]
MNFDDTPAEAVFRREVRAWIDANAPVHLATELAKASFGHTSVTSEDPILAAKAWQRKKADAGYACLQWPKEYGGAGLGAIERVIWSQEEGLYVALSRLYNISHGMCGPTVMAWGSEEAKRRLLPPLARGESIWCQLFSEPAAGSDLAGLRMRAEKAPDGSGDWIINGQKIWTSLAQHADYGLLLTRTDPDVVKHKGLTMFFLEMRSPGVEIRPIRQANGQSSFNEVYFTDVRISDTQRLGMVGQGWEVSLTTLMNERLSIGSGMPTGFPELFAYCLDAKIEGRPAIEDRMVRSRLAQFAVRASGLKYTGMRSITALSRGEVPGPENSIGKLVAGVTMQELAMFALDLQGQAGVLIDPDEADSAGRFQAMLMRSPATRIEGGSDEILRNIIAERVLGLPGEIRVDKTMPFRDIPARNRAG